LDEEGDDNSSVHGADRRFAPLYRYVTDYRPPPDYSAVDPFPRDGPRVEAQAEDKNAIVTAV